MQVTLTKRVKKLISASASNVLDLTYSHFESSDKNGIPTKTKSRWISQVNEIIAWICSREVLRLNRKKNRKEKSRTSMLLLIYVVTLFSTMGQGVVLPILPLFFLGLGISFSFLGIITAIPNLTRLVAQTPFGKISDKLGRKALIVIGFFVTAGIAPAYLLFNELNLVLFFRGTEGIAAALCAGTLTVALLSEITMADMQGKIMGRYQGFRAAGFAVGPLIGGYIADTFGTFSNFILWGFFSAVAGCLFLFLREPKRREILEIIASNDKKKVKRAPLVDAGFRLAFLGVAIISMMNLLGGSFLLTFLPPWAEEFGISEFYIGILIFGILGSMAISAFILGSLSDRYGRRKVIVGGSFIIAIGLFLYSFQQSYLHMLTSAIFAGFGSAIISPAIDSYVRDITHSTRLGESFGIISTISTGGTVFGSFVFGLIIDISGLRETTLLFSLVTLGMAFASLLIKETRKDSHS